MSVAPTAPTNCESTCQNIARYRRANRMQGTAVPTPHPSSLSRRVHHSTSSTGQAQALGVSSVHGRGMGKDHKQRPTLNTNTARYQALGVVISGSHPSRHIPLVCNQEEPPHAHWDAAAAVVSHTSLSEGQPALANRAATVRLAYRSHCNQTATGPRIAICRVTTAGAASHEDRCAKGTGAPWARPR